MARLTVHFGHLGYRGETNLTIRIKQYNLIPSLPNFAQDFRIQYTNKITIRILLSQTSHPTTVTYTHGRYPLFVCSNNLVLFALLYFSYFPYYRKLSNDVGIPYCVRYSMRANLILFYFLFTLLNRIIIIRSTALACAVFKFTKYITAV